MSKNPGVKVPSPKGAQWAELYPQLENPGRIPVRPPASHDGSRRQLEFKRETLGCWDSRASPPDTRQALDTDSRG